MYEAHFGMTDLPFRMAPDLHFYLDSAQYRGTVEMLLRGLAQGELFLILTGEPGSGKTTVVRRMLAAVDHESHLVGEIASSGLEANALLMRAAAALNFAQPDDNDDPLAELQAGLAKLGRQEPPAPCW